MSKLHHECYSKHRELYIHKQCGIFFILNHHLYADSSQICVSESDVFLTFIMLTLSAPLYLLCPSVTVNGTTIPSHPNKMTSLLIGITFELSLTFAPLGSSVKMPILLILSLQFVPLPPYSTLYLSCEPSTVTY